MHEALRFNGRWAEMMEQTLNQGSKWLIQDLCC